MEEINRPKRKRSFLKRKLSIILLIILFIIILITAAGSWYLMNAMGPVKSSEPKEVDIEIEQGYSAAQTADMLEENNLIHSEVVFRYYLRATSDSSIQAGHYTFSQDMPIRDIAGQLEEGPNAEPGIAFTVPEGVWLEDIASIISENTPYSEEEVAAELESDDFIAEAVEQYSAVTEEIENEEILYPLEGYLFPSTYEFFEEDTELQVILNEMIERTDENMVEYASQIEESDYTVHQLLTIASIVEREAQFDVDRPLIAGVIENRLEADMRLEVDPSVAYAIREHRYMTSLDDLDTESPYNTYRNAGLPPGPISSPGIASIEAVLEPEDTEYIFFYARPDGEVIYNESFEEHQQTQEQYRSEWEEGRQTEEEAD